MFLYYLHTPQVILYVYLNSIHRLHEFVLNELTRRLIDRPSLISFFPPPLRIQTLQSEIC